jgi:hypothetical protein
VSRKKPEPVQVKKGADAEKDAALNTDFVDRPSKSDKRSV